jgi:hypothetical protein
VSQSVADVYFPHELTPIGPGSRPRLTLQTLDLGPVLLGYVGWGADIAIDCDYPGAYEVNIPLTGHFVSQTRRGSMTSVSGQAAVFRADSACRITHWDATCTVLGVKFDRTWLDLEAERVLGSDPVRVAGVLPDQLDLDRGGGEDWRRLVNSLASHLRRPSLFAGSPVVSEQLAGAVAAGFLLTSCPDLGTGSPARPRTVSRVVDAVRDDPARPGPALDRGGHGGPRGHHRATTAGGLPGVDRMLPDGAPHDRPPATGEGGSGEPDVALGQRCRGELGVLESEPVRSRIPPSLRPVALGVPSVPPPRRLPLSTSPLRGTAGPRLGAGAGRDHRPLPDAVGCRCRPLPDRRAR